MWLLSKILDYKVDWLDDRTIGEIINVLLFGHRYPKNWQPTLEYDPVKGEVIEIVQKPMQSGFVPMNPSFATCGETGAEVIILPTCSQLSAKMSNDVFQVTQQIEHLDWLLFRSKWELDFDGLYHNYEGDSQICDLHFAYHHQTPINVKLSFNGEERLECVTVKKLQYDYSPTENITRYNGTLAPYTPEPDHILL